MKTVNLLQLKREGIIDALRSYTTHDQLTELMRMPTATIRGILAYHLSPREDQLDARQLPNPKKTYQMLVPYAITKDFTGRMPKTTLHFKQVEVRNLEVINQ